MKCSKLFDDNDDDDVINPDLRDENVLQLTVSDYNEINIYVESLLVSSNHNCLQFTSSMKGLFFGQWPKTGFSHLVLPDVHEWDFFSVGQFLERKKKNPFFLLTEIKKKAVPLYVG